MLVASPSGVGPGSSEPAGETSSGSAEPGVCPATRPCCTSCAAASACANHSTKQRVGKRQRGFKGKAIGANDAMMQVEQRYSAHGNSIIQLLEIAHQAKVVAVRPQLVRHHASQIGHGSRADGGRLVGAALQQDGEAGGGGGGLLHLGRGRAVCVRRRRRHAHLHAAVAGGASRARASACAGQPGDLQKSTTIREMMHHSSTAAGRTMSVLASASLAGVL